MHRARKGKFAARNNAAQELRPLNVSVFRVEDDSVCIRIRQIGEVSSDFSRIGQGQVNEIARVGYRVDAFRGIRDEIGVTEGSQRELGRQ